MARPAGGGVHLLPRPADTRLGGGQGAADGSQHDLGHDRPLAAGGADGAELAAVAPGDGNDGDQREQHGGVDDDAADERPGGGEAVPDPRSRERQVQQRDGQQRQQGRLVRHQAQAGDRVAEAAEPVRAAQEQVGGDQGEGERRLEDVGVAQERPGRVGGEEQEHQRPHDRQRPGQPPGEQGVHQGGVGREDQPADGEQAEHAGQAVADVRQLQAQQEPQRPALRLGVAERQLDALLPRLGRRQASRQDGERVVVAEEADLPPAGEVGEPGDGGEEGDGPRRPGPRPGGAGGGRSVEDGVGEGGHGDGATFTARRRDPRRCRGLWTTTSTATTARHRCPRQASAFRFVLPFVSPCLRVKTNADRRSF